MASSPNNFYSGIFYFIVYNLWEDLLLNCVNNSVLIQMPGEIFIEGELTELRTVETEDLDLLQRARNDPDMRKFLTNTPYNRVQTKEEFERIESNSDGVCLLIVPKEGKFAGEAVGYIQVFPIDWVHDDADIGFWVVPEAQRNRFATDAALHVVAYAFDQLGLHRLTFKTAEANKALVEGNEAFGHFFKPEGGKRELFYIDGERVDQVQFGILQSEWEGLETMLQVTGLS